MSVKPTSASFAQNPAFERIFEDHLEEIWAFLARRVGRDLGEELASETFARAFRGWSSYDVRRGPVRPWLFGIAANLVRDHRRSEVRGLRAIARAESTATFASTGTGGGDVRTEAESRLLATALAKLSVGDREVLLLTAWADLNSQEIAEALEIPSGTVRSRLNRARRQVRVALSVQPASPITVKEVVDGNG